MGATACKDGRSQSPDNITGTVDMNLPAIEMAYQAVPLKIVNNRPVQPLNGRTVFY